MQRVRSRARATASRAPVSPPAATTSTLPTVAILWPGSAPSTPRRAPPASSSFRARPASRPCPRPSCARWRLASATCAPSKWRSAPRAARRSGARSPARSSLMSANRSASGAADAGPTAGAGRTCAPNVSDWRGSTNSARGSSRSPMCRTWSCCRPVCPDARRSSSGRARNGGSTISCSGGSRGWCAGACWLH